MDIHKPLGNGRGGIYKLGEGVMPPPNVGLGPYLKEVAHRDETKRSN